MNKISLFSPLCRAPVIFLYCWCSKVVHFMLWVKIPIFSNNDKNNTLENITKIFEQDFTFQAQCVRLRSSSCAAGVPKSFVLCFEWKMTSSCATERWPVVYEQYSCCVVVHDVGNYCSPISHSTLPTTPQHSTIWKVMWFVEKLTSDRSYRYSIMNPYWYELRWFE